MTHNSSVSGLCFEIWFRRRKRGDTYTLKASSVELKKAWTADLERILWDQAAHSRGASSCHAALLLFVNSFAAMSLEGTLSRCCVFRASHAGAGVHGDGPQTFYGHSAQRRCHL